MCVWVACGKGAPRQPPLAPDTRELISVAKQHERARRYDLARNAYERAVREAKDPQSGAVAAKALASALIFWGEYEAAERALGTAIRLRPGQPSSWHDLGIIRAKRGDHGQAEAAFRRSIQLSPKAPFSRLALAALLVNLRRYPEALAEYEALKKLNLPTHTDRAIDRGMQLIREQMRRGH